MLRAPFPWFGGKSRVASLVWRRFGDVPNYVEPFAGSLAVLLARPHEPGTETVNDLDAYLANFWRAVRSDPEAVARWADWPVSEVDLHARHRWLVDAGDFRERMLSDPDYFDARVAGWWAWGLCCWIGSGWCAPGRAPSRQLPHLATRGNGLNTEGRYAELRDLSERLRRVRVACGDWRRVTTPAVTTYHGTTGVLLDPPYSSDEHSVRYSADERDVAADVRAWAIQQGHDHRLRIALCGYAGEHDMPDGWTAERWKARGGFGSQGDGRGRENAGRETVWFSPGCLEREQAAFDFAGGAA